MAAVLATAGCDSGSFVPSRPKELAGATSATAGKGAAAATPSTGARGGVPSAARSIELIAAPASAQQAEVVKSKARAMAGLEGVRIQVQVTGEPGAEEPQPALIRKAAGRNPLALVVEPADPKDPELARAVDEARAKGIPVVVMGPAPSAKSTTEGTTSAGVGPLIAAVPEPFPGSAKQIVAAAINNSKNIGFTPQGGAVLLINAQIDALGPARIDALRSALKEAGVEPVKELEFDGEIEDGKKKLTEVMKANPKIGMAVAAEHLGMTAAFQATNELGEERPYVVAGYSSDENSARMTGGGEFAASAFYSSERLLRKAIVTAAAVARGEKQPDRVDLMVPVSISPSNSGAPKLYRSMPHPGSPPAPGSGIQKRALDD